MTSASAAAIVGGVGEHMRQRRNGVSTGVPKRSTRRCASVRAAATVTCWPRITRTAVSKPSSPPGRRSAGARRHRQRGQRAGRSRPGRRPGRSAWRTRCSTRAQHRRQARRHGQVHLVALAARSGAASQPVRRCAAVRPAPACGAVPALDLLHAAHRAACEEAEQRRRTSYGGRQARRSAVLRRGATPRRWRAQLRRVQPVALGEGGVEAAQAAEAAGQRHLRHRQRGVGQQLLGQQQALRGQVVERRHAVRGLEDAPQVAVGDAQARGEGGQVRVVARRARPVRSAARRVLGQRCATNPSATAPARSRAGTSGRAGRPPPRPARALPKKRQFSRRGVRTRHTGRQ